MDSFPEALRSQISKHDKLQTIVSRLDKTQNLQKIWNLFNNIFTSEALPLAEKFASLPEKEQEKNTSKDICKLNLDGFKSDLLSLLKITFEYSISTTISKMNSLDQLKVELDPQFRVLTEPNTSEKLLTELTRTIERPLLTQPSETRRATKTLPISPGERQNHIQMGSYILDRFGLRDFKVIPKINSDLYQRLTQKITRKRGQNTSVDYYRELPPIKSDFHNIKGAASFAQSKRKVFAETEGSPGPANYSINTEASPKFKKQPAAIFGTANRRSWINDLEKREMSLTHKRNPSKN